MTTTPNLGQGTWDPGNAQPDLLYNSLLSVIDALVPTPVVTDKDLNAPPGSPVVGSLYIVGPTPTGIWAGRAGQLVAYTYANAWMFIAPKLDWLVYVADESANYRFDGTNWVEESTGGGFSNPMTTAGDLIVGGTAGAPSRAGIGTAGQVWTVVSGAPAWQTPTASLTNPMTTAGDVIVGGTSGAPARLAKGADGTVLTMVSGSQSWQTPTTPLTNPMTTAGDVIVGGTSGAPTRLAKGAEGSVLGISGGVNAYIDYTLIPQNQQTAGYTLVLSDRGKHLYHPSSDTTARTWTIPANSSVAYPIGSAVTFINDVGAGLVTIAITTDTLVLAGAGSTGSRTLAAGGIATAVKVNTTRWIISGTGLT